MAVMIKSVIADLIHMAWNSSALKHIMCVGDLFWGKECIPLWALSPNKGDPFSQNRGGGAVAHTPLHTLIIGYKEKQISGDRSLVIRH